MRIHLLLFFSVFYFSQLLCQDYWIPLKSPSTNKLTEIFFVDSLHGWAGGEKGTLLHTSDGGQRWNVQQPNVAGLISEIFMLNKNLGWSLSHDFPQDTSTRFGTIILKTTNGGTSWSQSYYDSLFFNTIYFQDSLVGFMGGLYGMILRSTNGGNTWKKVSDSAQDKLPVSKIRFYSPMYGYAVGGFFDVAGIIWRTSDGGYSWTSKVVSSEPVHDLYYKDSLNILCINGDLDFGPGFTRSTDGGKTWISSYLGVLGEPSSIAFRTNREGWVTLGFAGSLLLTTDRGDSWREVAAPNNTPVYSVVFPDSKHGYLVGYQGKIFQFNPLLTGVNREDGPVVRTIALFQNYPNPFNPTTVIRYQIPAPSMVRIQIFDLLGRTVATVVNEEQTAGVKEVQWNAANISAGIYFYRLQAGSFVTTRTMHLLR